MFSRNSVREAYFAPVILCLLMVGCALTTGELANVSMKPLLIPYLSTSIAITIVSLLVTMFWWVLQLARVSANAPLRIVKDRLRERAPYLLLPAVIFPLFLANFTVTKTAIPFLVGYSWDPFWAHADRMIFGDDAWRVAHRLLGNELTRPLQWFYVVVWGGALLSVAPFITLNASPKFASKFYTAMMATWLLAGFVLAYFFSAAGPVFAHVVSRDGVDQFRDLRAVLNSTLAPHSPIRLTQDYLMSALSSHVAIKGGGISAMPSMHVAVVSIYALAARRTPWFLPSIVLWILIFVCSGYFGYHYWIDGFAGSGVAALCWAAAERLSPSFTKICDDISAPHHIEMIAPTALPSVR